MVNVMASNTPEIKIEIEWDYTPPSYFEEKDIRERENYLIELDGGHITARMSADFYDSQPNIRESLTQELKHYFQGAQLIRRQAFEIHGGTINRLFPDGHRDTTPVLHSAHQAQTMDNLDLITTDNERVVHDTRRDRIEATKHLAGLSIRHAADPTVRRILDSFDAAVRYPGNELVYLYEVWEALQTKFRGEKKARKTLCISKDDRSWLTNLANKEPVNQGRHRGRFAGRLREATAEELDKARAIVQDMIVKYLENLDKR